MSALLDKAFSPAKLNGLQLRNRIIKAGAFEGMTPKGVPNERLIKHHSELSEGGVGLTTVAYCAAEADGRVMEEMMYMHEGIRPQLEELARVNLNLDKLSPLAQVTPVLAALSKTGGVVSNGVWPRGAKGSASMSR